MIDFSIEKGKKDFLTLRYGTRYIHSAVDPIKEAERMLPPNLQSNLFIVFGLGLGYHVRALLEAIGERDAYIFVFETDEQVRELCQTYAPLDDPRVRIFTDQELHRFSDFFHEHVPSYKIEHPVYIELKSETLLFQQAYKNIKNKLEEFFRYFFQSLFTKAEFAPLWINNILLNSPLFLNPSLSLFVQGDALLIAAGPTLNKSLSLLKKLYKKIPFFVVDTALKTLIQANIIPDVVVATDTQFHNYRDFFNLSASVREQIILACDISVYHKIPRLFKKIFFFRTEGLGSALLDNYLEVENLALPLLPPGGSVSAATLSLLYYLGAQNIIMVGQDLFYPHLTHAVGTIHYERTLYHSSKFSPIFNFFQHVIFQRGHKDLALENLSRWIEDFIQLSHTPLYQVEPIFLLKNSFIGLPEHPQGALAAFPKPGQRENPRAHKLLEHLLEETKKLRQAENVQEFLSLRNNSIFKFLYEYIFIKQDLYLNRRHGDQELYLGSCFRIIDRLCRADLLALRSFEK